MKSNFNLFKEMETMCEALRELMKDELEERERIAKEDGKKRVKNSEKHVSTS